MKFVIGLLFIVWGILTFLPKSGFIFYKYGLFESKWDEYRMGFSAREIKARLEKATDPELQSALKQSLARKKLANRVLALALTVFFIEMLLNSFYRN